MHAQPISIETFADVLAKLNASEHVDLGMLCNWSGEHPDLGPVVLVQGPFDFALVSEIPLELCL